MLKDITLGQYFPGNSFIHRLDPRTKLLSLVAYIVCLFLAVDYISYALMFVFLAVVIWISTIPVKAILRGMKPLVFILVFTGLLNLFLTDGDTKIVSFWGLTITLEGIKHAAFMIIRILMLISGSSAACVELVTGVPASTYPFPCLVLMAARIVAGKFFFIL